MKSLRVFLANVITATMSVIMLLSLIGAMWTFCGYYGVFASGFAVSFAGVELFRGLS